MRRVFVIVIAALLFAGCSTAERPEGVVERWLLALNQGDAGRPDRYASSVASTAVFPGWRSTDPGAFDVVEVGHSHPCGYRGPMICDVVVPFRVVLEDGSELRSDALVGRARDEGPAPTRVFTIVPARTGQGLPSEGGPPIGSAPLGSWLEAFLVAAALVAAAELVLRAVRGSAPRR